MNIVPTEKRVNHLVFGRGIVIAENDNSFLVEFDYGETKRFLKAALSDPNYFEIGSIDRGAHELVTIEKIRISNLFNRLNYWLDFKNSANVAILTAPNGCGKTTIFKFIDFLFNPTPERFFAIRAIPFVSFECALSNGYKVVFEKEEYKTFGTDKTTLPEKKEAVMRFWGDYNDFKISIFCLDQYISSIRVNEELLKILKGSSRADSRYALYDVEDYHKSLYQNTILEITNKISDLLNNHKISLNVLFIEANRLQKLDYSNHRNTLIESRNAKCNSGKTYEASDFIMRAKKESTNTIRSCLQSYNRLLSEAKNKLPSMYLGSEKVKQVSFEIFKKRWDEYHMELKKFHEIGLLDSAEEVINQNELENAYSEKWIFLSTYLDAFEDTLNPLQGIYEKFKLFSDI